MKNLSLMFAALVALSSAGCKKKSDSAAGGPTCAQAVSHSMDLSKAEMEKMGTDTAMMAKLVDVGVKRCTEDKWSPEAIKCMADAKTMTDAQGCYGKLSKEQQDAMNKAAMEMAMPSHEQATGSGSAAGSGSADGTGSAEGSGSAAAVSAAAGSAATGSAAAGSAAAGSADASGSAAAGSGSAEGSGSAK